MTSWLELFPHWANPIELHPAAAGVVSAGPRDDDELDFARFVDRAAKVEVHVHAEAAVPRGFYAGLAPAAAAPVATGPFTDFTDFLRRWVGNLRRIQRAEDYHALGRAFVADRAARRIVHTECHVSPLDTSIYRARIAPDQPRLELAASIAQFAAGLRDGMIDAPDVRVRAIVDLVQIATPADLDAAYAALAPFVSSVDNRDHRDDRIVVGIGLGGPERPDRAPFFAAALARFRALGLGVDVHSGEQLHVSAAAHAATIEALAPERVGHGIRGAAAGYFFAGALAACPLSNVLLGCHDGPLATHPIGEMLRRGLDVSINTDDPLLFGTNLVIEYVALRRAFGLDRDAFARTQANARRQLLAP